jgi:hypothetical protein
MIAIHLLNLRRIFSYLRIFGCLTFVKELNHNCQIAPVPSLIWYLSIKCAGRQEVEQMYGGHHGLPSVDHRHATLLEEGACHCHHCLIATFDHAILL